MKRRQMVGGVIGCASALALLTVSGPPVGAQQPRPRFDHLTGTANRAGFKPALQDPARQVKVLVQVSGEPVADSTAGRKSTLRARLRTKQRAVEQEVKQARGKILGHYTDVFNGVAAKVAMKDLPALSRAPGVVAVRPVNTYEPDNAAGGNYIDTDAAWQDLGRTGKGIKIAIMDTGVDYTHANFGGSGDPADFESNDGTVVEPGSFPTAKVVGGTDLVGDDYDAGSDDPARQVPKPDPDPLDCNGHGSHVAGSAGGGGVTSAGATFTGPYNNGTYDLGFRVPPGTAPEASILAYRVFGCEGSAADDVLLAAMERAMRDGADVLNMSLGSSFSRADSPLVQAVRTLTRAGVTVVASAGNDGPGAYITGGPSVADTAIGVAAMDASRAELPAARLSFGGSSLVVQNSNLAELTDDSLPVAVLRTSYPDGPVGLGCEPAEYANYPGGVEGKLVVTIRGVCGRAHRAVLGQQAGAAAVAMINTDPGFPPLEGPITRDPDTGEPFEVTIPFFGVRGNDTDPGIISAADGQSAAIEETTLPNPGFGRQASFSSGGPRNVDSAAKPDVTAPGVGVISTGVGSGTGPATISGTSMASPMTAGVAALVKQGHPSWDPGMVKAAIVSTADTASAKFPGYAPRVAGSGLVNARRAAGTAVVASTRGDGGNLSFGLDELRGSHRESQRLTLRNTGDAPVTYDLAATFNGDALGATVAVSPSSVTVRPRSSKRASVTLSLSRAAVAALPGADASNFGALTALSGSVTATPRGEVAGAPPLRVAFQAVPVAESEMRSRAGRGGEEGGTLTVPVTVRNRGVHAGTADVYAAGIADQNDVTGAEDAMDVRAVGVQSLPGSVLGGDDSDRALVFAVNTHGRWSTPSAHEFDVPIDTNSDGNVDFIVVGVDLGAVTAGEFSGQFAAFTFRADGTLVNAWEAIAPANGGTALLPVLASDIGLREGSSRFTYGMNAFSLVPGGLTDETATAAWDSHAPPVSTGQFVPVPAGGSVSIELTADRAGLETTPVRGWLVVGLDDRAGSAEADEIGLPTGSR